MRLVRQEEIMIRRLCLSVIALALFAVAVPQGSADAQSVIIGQRGVQYNGYGRGYYGGYRPGYYNAYGNGPYGYGYSNGYRNGYQYSTNPGYGYGYGPYYNGYGNAGYYGNSYYPSSNPLGYGTLNSFGISW
jgi:hypothetical protein